MHHKILAGKLRQFFAMPCPALGWFNGLMGASREQHMRNSNLTCLQMMTFELSLVLIQRPSPNSAPKVQLVSVCDVD